MFGGLAHQPAVDLTEKLLEIVPKGLKHIFYSDLGSVAVEVAMKMALQYWYTKGKNDKTKFITILKGYHGDTWNAMSVCDPVTGMHHLFNTILTKQFFAPQPSCGFYDDWDEADLKPVIKILDKHHRNIAAFILEPIVQGAGGMYFYHPEYLKGVRALCDKYNILLVADEIATGFGRSGKLFACEHSSVSPDIMCLGKAITGGYMSFAATLCNAEIAEVISSGEPGVFMHGPTFMGNPLACVVANANIQLLQSYDWQAKVHEIETQLHDELTELNDMDSVKDVRVLGAIGVVEMKKAVDLKLIQEEVIKHGIWIRPFNNLIYIMPPYIINKTELSTLTNGIKELINHKS